VQQAALDLARRDGADRVDGYRVGDHVEHDLVIDEFAGALPQGDVRQFGDGAEALLDERDRHELALHPDRLSDPFEELAAVELERQHGVPVEVLDTGQAQQVTPFDPDGIGGHLVNAAGGWAGDLGKPAGFDIPVVHSRWNVYSTADGALDRYVPMTVDFGIGMYLRSEGDRPLFGASKPDECDGYNVAVDWAWMESLLEIGCDDSVAGRPAAEPERLLGRDLREHAGSQRDSRSSAGRAGELVAEQGHRRDDIQHGGVAPGHRAVRQSHR
jgi:glycine/D-amino acid oxidase-like deaminating enzyme